jgi:Mitochondrial carrier protein
MEVDSGGCSLCVQMGRYLPCDSIVDELGTDLKAWIGTNEHSHASKHNEKRESKVNSLVRQIIASSLGTAVSVITLNPVVVIKIMLQRQDQLSESSMFAAARNVFKKQGLVAFWSGTGAGLLQAVPNSVLYMTAYEKIKHELLKIGTDSNNIHTSAKGVLLSSSASASSKSTTFATIAPGIAGALARFYAVSIITPLELIRTIQTAGSSENVLQIAMKIYRFEGMKGFYRGWSSTVLRDAPFSAVYWMTFERLKGLYSGLFGLDLVLVGRQNVSTSDHPQIHRQQSATGKEDSKDIRGGGHVRHRFWPLLTVNQNTLTFLSGATSGVIAAVLTHPFDVLKTQQQLSNMTQLGYGNPRHPKHGVVPVPEFISDGIKRCLCHLHETAPARKSFVEGIMRMCGLRSDGSSALRLWWRSHYPSSASGADRSSVRCSIHSPDGVQVVPGRKSVRNMLVSLYKSREWPVCIEDCQCD